MGHMHLAPRDPFCWPNEACVYHIGLPIVSQTTLDVNVRLISFFPLELRILDMQALISAFRNNPDLATVPPSLLLLLQIVNVCTGCDTVSFLNGLGNSV